MFSTRRPRRKMRTGLPAREASPWVVKAAASTAVFFFVPVLIALQLAGWKDQPELLGCFLWLIIVQWVPCWKPWVISLELCQFLLGCFSSRKPNRTQIAAVMLQCCSLTWLSGELGTCLIVSRTWTYTFIEIIWQSIIVMWYVHGRVSFFSFQDQMSMVEIGNCWHQCIF